jgi:hypothetical protein
MRTPPARTALEHQAPHATQRIVGTIRVRATSRGFYDNHIKDPGDVFTVRNKKEIGAWMERLPDDEPGTEPEKRDPAEPAARGGNQKPGASSANDVL